LGGAARDDASKLLSASSDESREYSNTLEAALDGSKRSKSL
jgi:hypothetical protein